MDCLLLDLFGQGSKDRGESEQALSQSQVVGGQVVDQEETQTVVMGTESFLSGFDCWQVNLLANGGAHETTGAATCVGGNCVHLDLFRDIDVVDQVLVVDDDNCVGVLWRRKERR